MASSLGARRLLLLSLVLLCVHPGVLVNGLDLKTHRCPVTGNGNCRYNATEYAVVCTNIDSPAPLEKSIKDLQGTNGRIEMISIQDSYLSHLPLMKMDLIVKVLDKIEFDGSLVAFLAPPKEDSTKQGFQPFLKGIRSKRLLFTSVPYVHALNWGLVDSTKTETIQVVSSRFVVIPESLSMVKSLKSFKVVDSELRWIDRRAFQDLENLNVIDLTGNHLDALEDGTFSSVSNLGTLNLSKNKIMSLSKDVFPSVSPSFVLYLNDNPLGDLEFEIFKDLTLRELHLEGTNLTCTCDGITERGRFPMSGQCFDFKSKDNLDWDTMRCQCDNPDAEESCGEVDYDYNY